MTTSFDSIETHLAQITKKLASIKSLNEIEHQREEFKFLSDSMINLMFSFKNFGHPLYVQYCHCVDDFKGAS
ncbi:DUF3347 domain-containing protein [Croceitalea vernalis]